MVTEQDIFPVQYILDEDDRIVEVNTGFLEFAAANGAPYLTTEFVIGKSIWDFVQDAGVKQLWLDVFQHVRATKGRFVLPYRCDSPELERYLEARVTSPDGKRVVFENRLVRLTRREPVPLFDTGAEDENIVQVCSVCKRMRVNDDWVPTEEGIVRLSVFAGDRPPAVSHGLCPVCFEQAYAELDKLGW